jgi:hypothetical protein
VGCDYKLWLPTMMGASGSAKSGTSGRLLLSLLRVATMIHR